MFLGLEISLVHSEYTVEEEEGAVQVCVSVVDSGTAIQDGVLVSVTLSTVDGVAMGQLESSPSPHKHSYTISLISFPSHHSLRKPIKAIHSTFDTLQHARIQSRADWKCEY